MAVYPPLSIRIDRSSGLGWLLLISHAAALLAVVLTTALLPWGRGLIGMAVLLNFLRTVSAWRQHDTRGVLALEISVRDELTVLYRKQWVAADVLDGSLVTPVLCSLRLRLAGQKNIWVLLLPDMVDGDALRRLRVWLKWRRR